MKTIIFPRYTQDVASERRTMFHSVEADYRVGDQLCIVSHSEACRGKSAVVTRVDRVRLTDLTTLDEAKINLSREEYLTSFREVFPEWAGEDVFAIEFRYGFLEEI